MQCFSSGFLFPFVLFSCVRYSSCMGSPVPSLLFVLGRRGPELSILCSSLRRVASTSAPPWPDQSLCFEVSLIHGSKHSYIFGYNLTLFYVCQCNRLSQLCIPYQVLVFHCVICCIYSILSSLNLTFMLCLIYRLTRGVLCPECLIIYYFLHGMFFVVTVFVTCLNIELHITIRSTDLYRLWLQL